MRPRITLHKYAQLCPSLPLPLAVSLPASLPLSLSAMYKHLFDIPLLTQYTQFVGVISFYLKTFILILAPGCRRQQIRLQNKFLAASPNHIYPKYAHFSISQSVFAICSLLIESFV